MATFTDDEALRQMYIEKIQRFRLLDDTFFNSCFSDNIEGMALMLRIITGRDDLTVTEMINQNEVPNIYGREVCFDVFAKDSRGEYYEFEVQRSDKGAVPRRARYNSSMMDAMAVNKNTTWDKIPQTCVIMVTENDVLKGCKPIYHIKRTIEEMDNAIFDDGAEIIYVNASYEADDALGKLMQDFHCTNPDDMNYPELAERARFFKTNEKGVRRMCEIMQEIMDEGLAKGRMEGRNEGEDRMGRLVEALVADGQNESVARVATDKAYRAEMYEKYNIT